MEDKKEEMQTEQTECSDETVKENPASEETVTEETIDNECEKLSRQDKKKIKKLEADCAVISDKLNAAEAKLAEETDKYARLFAEFDNYRKRSQKEKESIYGDAYADAMAEILPVLDNMERALQYKNSGDEENMAKGIELIMKSFTETLSKAGVSEIEALGKSFDPNLHNAVMHIEDDNFGEGEIVEVFMKGYIRGDRVLRHSMVKVAN